MATYRRARVRRIRWRSGGRRRGLLLPVQLARIPPAAGEMQTRRGATIWCTRSRENMSGRFTLLQEKGRAHRLGMASTRLTRIDDERWQTPARF